MRAEFAWFLELREEHKLIINGLELDYSSIIDEVDNFPIEIQQKKVSIKFECKYIRWSNRLNDEYSRFYFVNEKLELKNIKTTSLNKKGDNFWHSLIVISDFFNEVNSDDENEEVTPKLLIQESRKFFLEN